MKNCIIFLLIFWSLDVFAQIPEPPKSIPSPNAFSFAQYTNIPISHFTGLPQISMPIALASYKNLNIPIELTYLNSGFKPEQHPGWVGLGWSLNTGGVITRTVKGEFPDEFDFDITPIISNPNEKQATRNGFIYNTFGQSSLKQKLLLGSPVFMDTYTESGVVWNYTPLPHKLPYYANGSTRLAPYAYTQSIDPLRWLGEPASMYRAPGWFSGGGRRDAFSDEYNFNFMGISGKFMLQGGVGGINFVVQCNQKVKIEIMDDRLKVPFDPVEPRLVGPTLDSYLYYYSLYYEEGKYPRTFSGFIITTDNGDKYYFGKNAEMLDNPSIQNPPNEYFNSVGIEYSINAESYGNDFWTADSWYLTRVVCADGRKIDFEYQRKDFILNEYKSKFYAGAGSPSYGLSGKLISPVYLKSINSDFFKCDFFISKSNEMRPIFQSFSPISPINNVDFSFYVNSNQIDWYKLDSLVFSGIDIRKKKMRLQYNNIPSERLFLQKVIEYDDSNVQIATEFNYNNSKTLPNYLSSQTDHWGYWNGKSIVGLSMDNLALFTVAKESDFAYTLPGVLTKIKYPTGGEVNFEYEQNTYSRAVPEIRTQTLISSGNQLTGGVRLKKTIHFDPITNENIIKKYFYTSSYDPSISDFQNASSPSSGIHTRAVKYEWSGATSEIINYYAETETYPTSNFKILSDQSLFPVFDSYHVNYSRVFEVGENNGYSLYRYTDFESNPDENYISILNNITSPYTRFSDKGLERGLLKEVAIYDQQNNLVEKTLNTYRADYLENGVLPYFQLDEGQTFITSEGGNGGSGFGIYLHAMGSSSKFYKHRYLKDKEIKTSYMGGNEMSTQVQYYYENPLHGQVTKIAKLQSNGDTLLTKFTYPSDYTGFLPSRMVNKHSISTIIDKKIILKSMPSNTEKLLSGELFEYKLMPGNSQDFLLQKVYNLNIDGVIPYPSYPTFSIDNIDWTSGPWTKDLRYREIMNVTKYDANKNILVYKTNGNQLSHGIGYDTKNLRPNIIGFGTNDSAPKYAFESFEDITANGNITNSTSRTGSNSLFGTYILSGKFVGLEYVYIDAWAKGGNIPIITYNVNSTASGNLILQIGDWKLYRYALANYQLNNITINTNGSFVDDVKALPLGNIGVFKTYTYSKNLLVASSDEKEQLTFYEYDSFNRLKHIKDQHGDILKSIDYNFKP